MTESNQQGDNQKPTCQAKSGDIADNSASNQLKDTPKKNYNTHRTSWHGKVLKPAWGFIKHRENQNKVANIIAFIALIIGGLLAYWTYGVFNLAQIQSQSVIEAGNAAKQSANIAQRTLDSTNAFNRRIFKLQRDANISSDSTIKSTLAQTKAYNDKLLNAQKDVLAETKNDAIKKDKRDSANLAETKNQFQTENAPFLEIVNTTTIPKIEKNLPIAIKFNFFNHSKLPAQVITCKSRLDWSQLENVTHSKKEFFPQIKTNFYIANGVSQEMTCQVDSVPSFVVKGYNEGWEYIFLTGSCEYIDPVTKKHLIFSFEQRFHTKPIPGIDNIKSDITEVPH